MSVNAHADGAKSIVINCNELSFRALLRCIRRIPGTVVTDAAINPMNDDAKATIRYKDATLTLETPFSDYIINCTSPGVFDEFVSRLRDHKVKWWGRFF